MRAVAVGGFVVLLGALGACGHGGTTSSRAEPTGSSATGVYRSPEGAINDLSGVHCAAGADGVWSGSGTLTNPTKVPRRYDVTIAVIIPTTSEVLGQKTVRVTVKPGGSERVQVKRLYRGKAKNARCTPVVTLQEQSATP